MIVTIDGPAGAGKSTIARRLAARLGFPFLDTGAMYRVVTLAALRNGIDLADCQRVARLAAELEFDCLDGDVRLGGEDVGLEIRTSEVTASIRQVADNQAVRSQLVERQRQIGRTRGNLVSEGRDQGTVAFPNAECKIYLTASPEERARRRLEQLQSHGQPASFELVLTQQDQRDREDTGREVGRLAKAADTLEVATDGLSIEQVVARLEQIVRSKMPTP